MVSVLIKGGRMIGTTFCVRITEQVEIPPKRAGKNFKCHFAEHAKHVTDFTLANLVTSISYVDLVSEVGPETI